MPDPGREVRRPPAMAVVALAVLCLAVVVADIVVVAARRSSRQGVPYGSLKPDDCIDRPPSTVTYVRRVRCREPHELEVVSVSDDAAPPGSAYPGSARLVEQGAACVLTVRAATAARDPAQLKQVVMVPERRSWERGNRRLVCTVGRRDGRNL